MCLLICSSTAMATVVKWAIRPTYESITHYGSNAYKIKSNGKSGLIALNGNTILSTAHDTITDFHNGYALALTTTADGFKVDAIIDEQTFEVKKPQQAYYLVQYTDFHEDRLCVKDGKGKQGFMAPNGRLAIECKYLEVHPFSEGLASVTPKKGTAYYVRPDGSLLMGIEPGDGAIIFGSSFKNGEALVYARGATGFKGYYIGKNGKTIRGTNMSLTDVVVDDDDYTIYDKNRVKPASTTQQTINHNGPTAFKENGLYGFKNGDDVIVPPQFAWADNFCGDYALVMHDGKYGIVQLADGNVVGQVTSEHTDLKVEDGLSESFVYTVYLPESYADLPLELTFTDGQQQTTAVSENKGIDRTFSLRVPVASSPESKSYQVILKSDNIQLWESQQTLTFKYGPDLQITFLTGGTVQASDKDMCTVGVSVRNLTTAAKTVEVNISGGPIVPISKTVEIPANQSEIFYPYAHVTQTGTYTIKVTADAISSSKKITFKAFD